MYELVIRFDSLGPHYVSYLVAGGSEKYMPETRAAITCAMTRHDALACGKFPAEWFDEATRPPRHIIEQKVSSLAANNPADSYDNWRWQMCTRRWQMRTH